MGTEIYVIVGVTSFDDAGSEDVVTTSSSTAEKVLTAFMGKVGLAPQIATAAEDQGAYVYVGTGTGLYGQTIASTASKTADPGTPGSRSILIPVAGAIAGIVVIVAACGVAVLLKKRHSPKTL
jgi:hypothetical protein